jgi:hypothetical protein
VHDEKRERHAHPHMMGFGRLIFFALKLKMKKKGAKIGIKKGSFYFSL